jgi:LmbE family N-acetylglucosaminyl deacetylase
VRMVGALCLGIAIGAAACLFRLRRYRRWFRLPASRTDQLNCRGNHRTIRLIAEPTGFDLAGLLDLQGRTVLLQLTVKTLVTGRLIEPFIELRMGQSAHRQYFERGAAGQRYVNLTPLFRDTGASPNARIGLRGHSMRWDPQASLLVFEPPIIAGAGVLVLAPHPDDAEIAAFGMYATHRSWVATVTAGERGSGNLPSGLPPDTRSYWAAWLRVADSLSVPRLGHVPPKQRLNLVYPDGALESMCREPSRPFMLGCEARLHRSRLRSENEMPEYQGGEPGCTWRKLVEEIRSLIELAQPAIIVCPHPLLDCHPDHVYTAVALEQAMRGLSAKPPLLLLYVVHTPEAASYPFGPAESLASIPPGRPVGWMADSIYSHPLEPDMRQAKYFAIEAMHAARSCADAGTQAAPALLKSIGRAIAAYIAGVSLDPSSFLRRAPRPNELYYVVRGDRLKELMEQSPEIRSVLHG